MCVCVCVLLLLVITLRVSESAYLSIINPRRACASVTVVVLCVCLSVTALATSACVYGGYHRYTRVSCRLSLILTRGFLKHPNVLELWPRRANIMLIFEAHLQPFSCIFGTSQAQNLLHRLLCST